MKFVSKSQNVFKLLSSWFEPQERDTEEAEVLFISPLKNRQSGLSAKRSSASHSDGQCLQPCGFPGGHRTVVSGDRHLPCCHACSKSALCGFGLIDYQSVISSMGGLIGYPTSWISCEAEVRLWETCLATVDSDSSSKPRCLGPAHRVLKASAKKRRQTATGRCTAGSKNL